MKKIQALGIIGGMGPLADVTFLRLLHSHTAAERDREYLPVIYDGNCLRPDRSDYLTGKTKKSPFESLRYSLKFLERAGATVIVMPCNTAHFWFTRLKRIKKRNTVLLDMIYETCKACQSKGLARVCLLSTAGTRKKELYGEYLFRMGVDLVYPSDGICEKVSALIKKVKCGEKCSLSALEEELKSISCDGFILGCTELSAALEATENPSLTYVDSLSALARKTLKVCKIKSKPFDYA